ncbi:MAG: hypothetical protein IPL19_33875 [Sandaracinaceae bacterium]|nr:hypothetical protein [Sandaracinaceae bacterium]MBK8588051.1 hypothetical protein [Sandaracinaceae bacterium]
MPRCALARCSTAALRLLLVVLALGGAGAGCSDGLRGFDGALPNGAQVTVTPDGALRIVAGEHPLFALAAGRGVVAHQFDSMVYQRTGFYTFEETNAVSAPIAQLVGAALDGDDVVVRYRRADREPGTASVRIHGEAGSDSTRVSITVEGVDELDAVGVPVHCDAQASFLGFGAQYNATDQRGEAFPLFVQEQGIGRMGGLFFAGNAHSTYFPMPYHLDARGFGVVFDTFARVVVDLCQTETDVASFRVDGPGPVEIELLHGPTPGDVVRQLGDRYGRPAAPETWVFEPWIGVQGGQQAVIDEAAALDAAQVPWTALWAQDWVGYQPLATFDDIKYHWNVDEALYPDLRGLTDMLHADGKRFLGYINPFVEEDREHFEPMDSMGLLIHDAAGDSYLFNSYKGPTTLPDLTNAAAREHVAGFIAAMMSTHGMDGWMADFAEWMPTDAVLSNGESALLVEHNRYPLRWQELNHETARGIAGNDYAIFSRSGWLGSQGTTQIVWIGDQEADFLPGDGLPTVVPALLNLGLSGVPFATHDIAGYSGGPSTMELFMRWTELGAFTSVMRTHEGLNAAANWSWNGGPTATPEQATETIAHFRRFARIHMALVPTFEALAEEAASTSMPVLRHMILEFPDDPAVVGLSDQFMLGSDLLVAPVVTEGAVEREVYFPAGQWHHALRAGEMVQGPGTFTVSAPLGEPPVFSRGAERSDLRAID